MSSNLASHIILDDEWLVVAIGAKIEYTFFCRFAEEMNFILISVFSHGNH
jgi:hypothetical protein